MARRLAPCGLDTGDAPQEARRVTRVPVVCATIAALAAAPTATPSSVTILKAHLTGAFLHTTSKGSGSATITFKTNQVCWKFNYTGLDTPGDSGIHQVPPPAAGKHKTSVFPFTASTSLRPGCVTSNHWGASSEAWVAKIVASPAKFYVIIGTKKFPQGAIGGVLRRS
jgi:CHRD domain